MPAVFEEEEDPATKSYFSEIIASISDVKFSRDGKYIITRDYLTVKVWDVAMDSRPVYTLPVHEHLRPKLCDLYENDCIFDKFEVCVNPTGRCVVRALGGELCWHLDCAA
jgi:serine/threonine-protein phosphatase 2A regulatory subunit B